MRRFIFLYVISLSLLGMGFLYASATYGQEKETRETRSKLNITKNSELIPYKKGLAIPVAMQPKTMGVLVLAHGAHHHGHGEHGSGTPPSWDAAVLEAVKPLKDKYPLEVAFGMADPDTIKDAVRKLEKKGVSEVIVVPLFISSHSPIIGNSRFILGLQGKLSETTSIESLPRIESKVKFYMTGALDDSILVAEILLERAMELSANPSKETIVLVGHGPNDEKENKLWLDDMERLAYYVREKGKFKEVKVATWRSDAPKEIKQEAINKLRTMVENGSKDGSVIVVPLLLAPNGVEGEIVEALKGLSYSFDGKTLLPHDNITKWMEEKIEGELAKSMEKQK